ncbi:Ubiquinone/menaquinone biosynthesis C-methyltransferase UbiE [uncultured archaeon]|nr:Ubiquinone/menaquinone biosynthesis C-methyltransferase UbiE [uncultured archaeon]
MVKSDYDKFAEEFSRTREQPWKEVSDFLETLPKNSQILDIGCGNGRHLIEAKKRGLNAVGLDISKNLLKIAKKKTGAHLVLGNALALPFRDRTFDNSICIAVVHHFGTQSSQKLAERHDFKDEKDRIQALKEAARVSKSAILISVWAFEQKNFAKRKSQDIQLEWNKKFPRFYHLFKEGELDALAKKAGLKVKKSWREGNNYWAKIRS